MPLVNCGNKTGKKSKTEQGMKFYRAPAVVTDEGELIEKLTAERRRNWISMISEESQCGIEANGKFIPINCVTAKLVYNLCISHTFSPPTSKKLLSTKFNIADQKTWSSVYLLPASTTLDTKIRMFQYNILNNILYLKQRLYHMELADSPLCSLCKREFETISHLFLRCESSKRHWAEIQKWSSHTVTLPQLSEDSIFRIVFQ